MESQLSSRTMEGLTPRKEANLKCITLKKWRQVNRTETLPGTQQKRLQAERGESGTTERVGKLKLEQTIPRINWRRLLPARSPALRVMMGKLLGALLQCYKFCAKMLSHYELEPEPDLDLRKKSIPLCVSCVILFLERGNSSPIGPRTSTIF